MLKRREKLIIKLLVLAMCTSLVPTTVAFAEGNVQETVTNAVQTTSSIAKATAKATTKVTSIKLNKANISIIKGNTLILTATPLPSTATNKAVTWKSSNIKVATVDANGKVTAIAKGVANITCTAQDGSKKISTCKVTVTNPVSVTIVTSVVLNKTNLSVAKGTTETLTTTVAPSTATNKEVTWKSSNTKLATVDANGKITAVAKGTVNITCTAKDGSKKSATCKVTITDPAKLKVTSVKLNKSSISVVKGKTAVLTATVAPSAANNKAVTWQSSNTKVATIDDKGKITAVGAGTANITCTAKDGSGKSATCVVTVTATADATVTGSFITKPKLVTKDNDLSLEFTVNESGTYLFTGEVYNANGKVEGTITWDEENMTAGDVVTEPISDTLAEMEKGQYCIFKVTPKNNANSVVKSEKITVTKSGTMNLDTSKITASGIDEDLILKANTNFAKGLYTYYGIEDEGNCYVNSTECNGNTSSLTFEGEYSDWKDGIIKSMKIARIYDLAIASDGSATCKVEMSKEFVPSK